MALEDKYIWGPPTSILQRVFMQTTLPKGLDRWKTVVHDLDRLHCGLMESRQSTNHNDPLAGCSTSQLTGHSTVPTMVATTQPAADSPLRPL